MNYQILVMGKRCKQQTKPYGTYRYCKRKRKLSESVQVYEHCIRLFP